MLLYFTEARTRAVVGFNPDQWSEWYKNDPQLANLDRRPPGKRLVPDSQKFLDTGGDVFFLLKSDVQGEVEKVHDRVEKKMRSYCDRMDATHSQPPSNVRHRFYLSFTLLMGHFVNSSRLNKKQRSFRTDACIGTKLPTRIVRVLYR